MTQPAISQQVSELERLLETRLFFRHAKGVEPTAAAKDLLPIARRVIGALQDGSEAVASRLISQAGTVKVSASPAAVGGMLHGALSSFTQAHPEIQVHIIGTGGRDPHESLAGELADIICGRQTAVVPNGWTFEVYSDDMLIVVCGARHRLANHEAITPGELGRCKWLQNRVGSVARKHFEHEYERNGWSEETRCRLIMHIPELTKELLGTGKYLAILPQSVARPWLIDRTVRKLNTSMNVALPPLGFLWQPDQAGEATAKFAAHLSRKPAKPETILSFCAGRTT